MAFIPEIFTPYLSTNVNQGGYRPILVTVPADVGYASNSFYGAGATPSGSYSIAQAQTGNIPFVTAGAGYSAQALTQVNFRKEDVTVDFTVALTLNASLPVPPTGAYNPALTYQLAYPGQTVSTTDELRIITQPVVQGEPFTYQSVLPEASYGFGCPRFDTFEVLGTNYLVPNQILEMLLPSQQSNILTARLLSDQTLALLRINMTTSPTSYTPLTVADINDIIVGGSPIWGTADAAIYILLRGSYYAAN